ncbi:hypothetical protein ACROYT_G018223 [Oculina patagonica]
MPTVHSPAYMQCPQCAGDQIKIVDVITGECISCFPCLACRDSQTSSVPCGSTVRYGTEIKCVLIQSDPVASVQTRHLTATAHLTISSTPKKLIVTPVTSVTNPVLVSATSSSASSQSSTKQSEGSDTTKKRKGDKVLPLEEWNKYIIIYLFGGIILAITSVVIICRIFKWKSSKQRPVIVNPDNKPPNPSLQPLPDVSPQVNETCNISVETSTVAFNCHNDNTSEMRERNQRSHPGTLYGKFCRDLHRNCARALRLTAVLEQGRPAVNLSAFSQREKYQKKVLEMPFSLLYKICLRIAFDIPRADGNDVRVLAERLGTSVGDLALLKQAAITQNPDNAHCNSITYAVLAKKSSLTVGDFVNIMEDIERDNIVSLINN